MRRRGFRIVVRVRAARGKLARFLGGSVVIHGLLLAALVVIPTTRHRTAPMEDSMVVALAGSLPSSAPASAPAAAPAPRAPEPAAPAPKPPPKEAHTVREVPVEKPKPVKPRPAPATPPAPAPPASEERPPSSEPAAGGGAHGGGTGAAGAATGVTATIGGGDSTLGWYGAAVKAALESAWAKPYLEDETETHSVVIAFDIARDGTTRNLRIVQSSGIPSLDRSAQRAVIEASPLPAVPPSWTGDALPATMRFDLTPDGR